MSLTVLVVDDSKLARMALAKALNAIDPGWTRLEAGNADEAVALLRDHAVDIVLLDFNMPGRDGLELAAEIRRSHPAAQVALISANHQTEIVNRAAEVGAAFLPKPLNEAALRSFLQAAVGRLGTTTP